MSAVMYKFLVLSLIVAIAVSDGMTQAMRDRILLDHNNKRRTATNAANMIELRYDMVLEQVAQAYLAKGCAGGFQHNPNRGCDYTARGGTNGGTGSCASVGENWYSGYTDNTTGVDVAIGGSVAQWTDGTCSSWATPPLRCNSRMCSEKQNFYQTGSDSYGACSQTSGEVLHYTQLMWATTAYVGCGYTAACGTLCDYALAGNMNLPPMGSVKEANVWKVGTPCSTCPSGYTKCNNGLCSATTSSGGSGTTTTPVNPPATSAPTATSCAADTTSKPTNGNVGTCAYSSAVGYTCSQTCNTGYTLTSGSLTRQCKTGGVWAATTAVCSATSSQPTTSSGVVCYSTNNAVFAGLTPTTAFKSASSCPSTLSSNCQVCGPVNPVQTGSTSLQVNVNITCTSAAGYISYGAPAFVSITGWSGSSNIPYLTTLASTASFSMKGGTSAANANVRAEWCINRQYYAAFPVTLVHRN